MSTDAGSVVICQIISHLCGYRPEGIVFIFMKEVSVNYVVGINLFRFKINLIAPPLYVLTTQTLEWNEGLVQLEKVLEAIKNSIEEQEGSFKLQQKVSLLLVLYKFVLCLRLPALNLV